MAYHTWGAGLGDLLPFALSEAAAVSTKLEYVTVMMYVSWFCDKLRSFTVRGDCCSWQEREQAGILWCFTCSSTDWNCLISSPSAAALAYVVILGLTLKTLSPDF